MKWFLGFIMFNILVFKMFVLLDVKISILFWFLNIGFRFWNVCCVMFLKFLEWWLIIGVWIFFIMVLGIGVGLGVNNNGWW